MITSPITSSPASLALPRTSGTALGSSQQTFSSILARATASSDSTPEQRARAAAEQFVSIAFVQPLLQQLRAGSTAAAPFAPSQAEKQFQSLVDAQIAERITRASNFPLVDTITRQLLDRARSAATPASGPQDPQS